MPDSWAKRGWYGIATALKGMRVTFRHVFRHPVTVEYPEVDVESRLPERYRGILHVEMDLCVSCRACEAACPISCILIEDVRGERIMVPPRQVQGKPTPKVRFPLSFLIDIGKCMFCGLCVEPCPTGAIRHTKRFEGTVESVSDLVIEYVSESDRRLAQERRSLVEAKSPSRGSADGGGGE